ncbi:MAG: substrate-binding domain-containing protein [Lachnospiraceae bacterium]|nr:substrate-binding domain-containing protein [Lachnospiraceae bacterium]
MIRAISRREFMKGMMIGGAAVGSAGILAACGTSSSESSADSSTSSSASTDESSTEATQETTTEREKLVVALQQNTYINDHDDNYLTHYLEEKLGIEIEFYLLPADGSEACTKLSLMATDPSSLPDVLVASIGLSDMEILNYGQNGIFMDLTDYLADPEKTPNWNAIPDEDREIMETASTQADGRIYSLIRYEPELWNLTPYHLFINRAWLDTLGLELPTTTEELKDVLIAFRDGDPNGSGVQDEIGVWGYSSGGYGQNTIKALMNSFIFWPDSNDGLIATEDGSTIIPAWTQDEFKEGLLYLNDLYNEKVLDPSIFTVDDTQFKATLNAETNVVGLVSIGSTSNYSDTNNNVNFVEMEMMPVLKGPKGVAWSPQSVYSGTQASFVFANTDKADLAVKFLDEFYSYTTSMTARYGEEEVDWTTDEDVCAQAWNVWVDMGIFDRVKLYVYTSWWSTNSSQFWHNVGIRYASLEDANTKSDTLLDEVDTSLATTYNMTDAYEFYYEAHPEHLVPGLKYTAEEVEANTDAMTNIPDHVSQSIAEFVTGARDIETEWDTYLAELDAMGLQGWLEAAQAAYDRTK